MQKKVTINENNNFNKWLILKNNREIILTEIEYFKMYRIYNLNKNL